jgi:hypothetical protein
MPDLIETLQARDIQTAILSQGNQSICTKFCQSDFLEYHKKSKNSEISCEFLAGNVLGNDYVFPFNTLKFELNSTRITSHSGSPYGGVCVNNSDPTLIKAIYMEIFEWFYTQYIGEVSFEVRLPPSILYDSVNAHEWALWSLGFQAEVVYLGRYFNGNVNRSYNRNRTRRISKLDRSRFKIENMSIPTPDGYQILTKNRQGRHSVSPLHSLADFLLIEELSPGTVSTLIVSHENYLCSIAITFQDTKFSTLQYLAGSECSFNCGSQDLLVDELITKNSNNKSLLLLGTSTNPETNHRELNHGLDLYKQSFGATTYSAHRLMLHKRIVNHLSP